MTRFDLLRPFTAAVLLLALAAPLHAQQAPAAPGAAPAATAASSPAKKELVQRLLKLQQQGIEGVGDALANQTASQMMQAAGQALARVPPDKREAVAASMQGDIRKFYQESSAILRERAVKLAPTTLGAVLEERFTEDELRSLVAWLESPVARKFQQFSGELQQSLTQKLVDDTRAQIEPKMRAAEQALVQKINAASAPAAPAQSKPAAPTKGGEAKK